MAIHPEKKKSRLSSAMAGSAASKFAEIFNHMCVTAKKLGVFL